MMVLWLMCQERSDRFGKLQSSLTLRLKPRKKKLPVWHPFTLILPCKIIYIKVKDKWTQAYPYLSDNIGDRELFIQL